jgi:hypothetical protein
MPLISRAYSQIFTYLIDDTETGRWKFREKVGDIMSFPNRRGTFPGLGQSTSSFVWRHMHKRLCIASVSTDHRCRTSIRNHCIGRKQQAARSHVTPAVRTWVAVMGTRPGFLIRRDCPLFKLRRPRTLARRSRLFLDAISNIFDVRPLFRARRKSRIVATHVSDPACYAARGHRP